MFGQFRASINSRGAPYPWLREARNTSRGEGTQEGRRRPSGILNQPQEKELAAQPARIDLRVSASVVNPLLNRTATREMVPESGAASIVNRMPARTAKINSRTRPPRNFNENCFSLWLVETTPCLDALDVYAFAYTRPWLVLQADVRIGCFAGVLFTNSPLLSAQTHVLPRQV
jgi:hypothetical protein